jgi:hypothetical protein
MFNKGCLNTFDSIPIYEIPKQLTTRVIVKKIEPTALESQSANILFCLFNPTPLCKTEVREERCVYMVNDRSLFGFSPGLFASKDSIISLMSCCS